jgi:2'-phosphotransferase
MEVDTNNGDGNGGSGRRAGGKSNHTTPNPKYHRRPLHPPKSNNNDNKKLSHALSWVLRHSATELGLTMLEDGFVPVREILDSDHPRLRCATSLERIRDVVETSDKNRFKLEHRPLRPYQQRRRRGRQCRPPTSTHKDGEDDDDDKYDSNGINVKSDDGNSSSADDDDDGGGGGGTEEEETTILCIRANQGHSIKTIKPELLLTKMSPQELSSLPCIIHGTYSDAWRSIEREGLSRMTRTHIHFACGLPKNHNNDNGEDGDNTTNNNGGVVISGMRQNCSVRIYLDVAKCAAAASDGVVEFYKSENGVILTDGVDQGGILPPEFFSHVMESSTGNILLGRRPSSEGGGGINWTTSTHETDQA